MADIYQTRGSSDASVDVYRRLLTACRELCCGEFELNDKLLLTQANEACFEALGLSNQNIELEFDAHLRPTDAQELRRACESARTHDVAECVLVHLRRTDELLVPCRIYVQALTSSRFGFVFTYDKTVIDELQKQIINPRALTNIFRLYWAILELDTKNDTATAILNRFGIRTPQNVQTLSEKVQYIAERYIHHNDRQRFLEFYNAENFNRNSILYRHAASEEYRVLGDDGSYHWVCSNVVPAADGADKYMDFISDASTGRVDNPKELHTEDAELLVLPPKPLMLIAEHSPMVLDMLVHQFENDYQIISTNNSNEAWEIICSNEIEIVLLDMDLTDAERSSFELLRKIKNNEKYSRIPVLAAVTSGKNDAEDALLLGADDFLTKPCSSVIAKIRTNNIMARSTFEKRRLLDELTRMQQRNEVLRFKAEYDELTRLYNRATSISTINSEILTKTEDTKSALLVLDLDGFKGINDTYGHLKGDKLLSAFAMMLRSSVRVCDVVGRIGGDEFILYMNGIQEIGNAVHKAKELIEATSAISARLEITEHISVSIGIVEIRAWMNSYEDAFRLADLALYRAKQTGKNRCVLAD